MTMKDLIQTCGLTTEWMKSIGIMQIAQDDENTGVMRWFKNLFEVYIPGLNVYLADISGLRI